MRVIMHFQEHISCSKQDKYPCHVNLISLVYLQKSLFSKFLFLVFLSTFSQFAHVIFRFESGYKSRILDCVTISSPGDLPDPETEAGSPALQADSLPSEPH